MYSTWCQNLWNHTNEFQYTCNISLHLMILRPFYKVKTRDRLVNLLMWSCTYPLHFQDEHSAAWQDPLPGPAVSTHPRWPWGMPDTNTRLTSVLLLLPEIALTQSAARTDSTCRQTEFRPHKRHHDAPSWVLPQAWQRAGLAR